MLEKQGCSAVSVINELVADPEIEEILSVKNVTNTTWDQMLGISSQSTPRSALVI